MSFFQIHRRRFLGLLATVLAAAGQTLRRARAQSASKPQRAGNQKDSVLLADMSQCLPKTALSTRRRKHHWQLLDYEIAAGKGVMISAGLETQAPDVTLALKRQGWHAIYLGIWQAGKSAGGYARSTQGGETVGAVKFKLNADPCFTLFRREQPGHSTLEEVFWKYADLTGQDLIIGQLKTGFHKDSSLAYVRLEPLEAQEVEEVQRDRARQDTKKLIATNDHWGVFARGRITTTEGIWEHVELYRNTDFSKIFWEVGCGWLGGWGGEGKLYAEGVEDFPRAVDRNIAESIEILHGKGINTIKTAMDHAHRIGLEFHVSQRTQMFQMAPPYEEVYSTEFYGQHPELRQIDRDGTIITGLSYAYPEVRKHHISFFEKAASLGADGVVIIYPRKGPYLIYEPPLVEGYKKRFGVDPREIDERNERWLRYRAGFMTQYMREVREAMNKVGEKLGKRLQVSAIINQTQEDDLFMALDPETWVKQGLVDNLIPLFYPSTTVDSHIREIRHLARITRGSPCKVYPNVMPRHMPCEEYRRKALAYYDAGADGLLFWDTYQRNDATAQWPTLRRLGHLDELRAWADADEHDEEPRLVPLLSLAGHTMTSYSPYRGG